MDITCVIRPLINGQVIITWLILTLITGVRTLHPCNQCDCTFSDPDNGEKAIFNIKPRCHEGQLTWLSSYGAVRIELSARHSGEHKFCVRVQSENIKTVVSQEVHTRTHGNYKLKILDNEEIRLSPLFSTRGIGKEFCISATGSVDLYLETVRESEDTGVAKVKINYDIEKSSSPLYFNPMEECRPCTDRELLHAYCTGDFVAVGTMDAVLHNELEDMSSIHLAVTQLLHQNEAIFRKPSDGWTRPHEMKGVVHAPQKCGIRYGDGQFMFTGRVRLGQPVLQCAPRYQQWKHLLEKALVNGELDCPVR